MSDAESQFLDALYLWVRDLAEFDHALTLLCGLFEVNSATLIDSRPETSPTTANQMAVRRSGAWYWDGGSAAAH
jgi:hypothetical protein